MCVAGSWSDSLAQKGSVLVCVGVHARSRRSPTAGMRLAFGSGSVFQLNELILGKTKLYKVVFFVWIISSNDRKYRHRYQRFFSGSATAPVSLFPTLPLQVPPVLWNYRLLTSVHQKQFRFLFMKVRMRILGSLEQSHTWVVTILKLPPNALKITNTAT